MLQKKLLVCAIFAGLSTLALSANAALPGFYLGGNLGWGDTNYNHELGGTSQFPVYTPLGTFNAYTHTSVDDTGLAGGGDFGYQFCNNWAIEGGFTQFTNTKVRTTFNGAIYNALPFPSVQTYGGSFSQTIRESVTDLVAKGILPLENGFALYGKLGGAYIYAPNAGTSGDGRVAPTASVGLSYDITPNLPIDVGYTRVQRVWSDNTSAIQSVNYVGVGLTYHFG